MYTCTFYHNKYALTSPVLRLLSAREALSYSSAVLGPATLVREERGGGRQREKEEREGERERERGERGGERGGGGEREKGEERQCLYPHSQARPQHFHVVKTKRYTRACITLHTWSVSASVRVSGQG